MNMFINYCSEQKDRASEFNETKYFFHEYGPLDKIMFLVEMENAGLPPVKNEIQKNGEYVIIANDNPKFREEIERIIAMAKSIGYNIAYYIFTETGPKLKTLVQ